METEILPATDRQQIETQTSALVSYASALVVDSPERYTEAAEFSKTCAEAVKKIRERLDPICESAFNTHKAATKLRADLLTVPQMARTVVDAKALRWKVEQDEIREAAEREAREKAQRQADEERLKLAEKAEAIGDTTTRDTLLDHIGNPSPRPIAMPTGPRGDVPAVSGFSTTTLYKAQLKPNGLKELVQAASRDDRLLCYLLPDLVALNRVARAQRESFNVPGIELVKLGGTRVRP